MQSFFAELKRRHVYRVAAAYAAVAWAILQIVSNVASGLNLPNSSVTLVIVLLAAGFPIVLIFAWVLDLKSSETGASARASTGVLGGAQLDLARMYASLGRYEETGTIVSQYSTTVVAAAVKTETLRLLHAAPSKTLPKQDIRLGPLGFVYLYAGTPERALEDYEVNADAGFIGPIEIALVWHPSYAVVRQTERFKALMKKVGLVDYWRAKGWPALCRPIGADDFVCD